MDGFTTETLAWLADDDAFHAGSAGALWRLARIRLPVARGSAHRPGPEGQSQTGSARKSFQPGRDLAACSDSVAHGIHRWRRHTLFQRSPASHAAEKSKKA